MDYYRLWMLVVKLVVKRMHLYAIDGKKSCAFIDKEYVLNSKYALNIERIWTL